MLNKIFNYLQNISFSEYTFIECNNLHIAFLCSNNRIFFVGNNSSRTKVSSLNYLEQSLHAEVDVIRSYKLRSRKKKLNLYVVRINKNNDFLFSKPCPNCMSVISNQNFIKNIYYYDKNNFKKLIKN